MVDIPFDRISGRAELLSAVIRSPIPTFAHLAKQALPNAIAGV